MNTNNKTSYKCIIYFTKIFIYIVSAPDINLHLPPSPNSNISYSPTNHINQLYQQITQRLYKIDSTTQQYQRLFCTKPNTPPKISNKDKQLTDPKIKKKSVHLDHQPTIPKIKQTPKTLTRTNNILSKTMKISFSRSKSREQSQQKKQTEQNHKKFQAQSIKELQQLEEPSDEDFQNTKKQATERKYKKQNSTQSQKTNKSFNQILKSQHQLNQKAIKPKFERNEKNGLKPKQQQNATKKEIRNNTEQMLESITKDYIAKLKNRIEIQKQIKK